LYEETNAPLKAIACYQSLIQKGAGQPELAQKATTNLHKLEEKRSLWEETYSIKLYPFPSEINTPNHESLARWTLDGQHMIFTRLLNEQEDIFMAHIDSVDHSWIIEDFPFNTPQNEGAQAISPDGKYLIFTSCNRQDGMGSCDLYLSVYRNEGWSSPVNMGLAFNSPSWDGQPCFGLDGTTLYFSSSRPGGMGGRDIWYVYQIAVGKWSRPINVGPMINTADNEESPFIHFDGQTLYFMRDGKDGLGGYDLYMSRKALDGKWQKPENMGAPINSGSNEGALSLYPDGSRAVITRETENQRNDLFEFELPEKYKAAPLQALKIFVVDQQTQQPLRARVEIFEVDKADTIRMSQMADEMGRISVTLERRKKYGLIGSADGYMMYSSSLEADTSAVRTLYMKMVALNEAIDKVIVLQNVFFNTASSSILPTSEPELNKLLWTLRNNKNMTIEIRGHTDNVSDEKTNLSLSEARAKSVYDYLIGRAIEPSRVTYKGYGETQPVADNTTEEGRKQNRRTEFRVVAN
jgi:outer membrane protein OmpA-like peptidoglycan-associated protein